MKWSDLRRPLEVLLPERVKNHAGFHMTLSFLTPCATQEVEQRGSRDTEEFTIREAVFRYQFEHIDSGGKMNVYYYFLSFGNGQDPPLEFMDRFDGHVPKVEPVSMSDASALAGVSHKQYPGTGLIFGIEIPHWLDGNTVDVEGGYYYAGLSASGNTYRVERLDRVWVVTEDTMHWIS